MARRVNAGWWLARFNLLAASGLSLLAVVVLFWRTFRWEPAGAVAPFVFAAVLILSAGAAWWWSRGKFIGVRDGLVRLDDRLGLRNRLTAAAEQAAPWPPFRKPAAGGDGLRWRWPAALLPGLLAAALVAAAWWAPLPEPTSDDPLVTSEPEAWEQMEEWAETLEEEDLVEPSETEEIAERIEELRSQPESEWFSHASLEATDTLRDQLARDIRDLASGMSTMERDLEALRSRGSELSEAGREMLSREYDEALRDLSMNGMKMNEELARQLGQVDPSQLGKQTSGKLSSEQMKALQKRLGQGAKSLGSMKGLPPMEEDSSIAGMMKKQGTMPGSGGIQRGPGEAPLHFGEEDDLGTDQLERVANEDLSRAAPGDLIGVGETEHEDDEQPSSTQAGGAVASQGSGGDAVWREDLLPGEKALLKRYFD